MSSRILHALRNQLGHTYGVRSLYQPRLRDGTWLLETSVEPGKVVSTLELLEKELSRLCHEPVTAEELARARNLLRQRMSARLRSSDQASSAIAEAFVLSDGRQPLDLQAQWQRYYGALEAVTSADLQALACRSFSDNERGTVVAGALSEFMTALRRWDRDAQLYVPDSVAEELEREGIMRRAAD